MRLILASTFFILSVTGFSSTAAAQLLDNTVYRVGNGVSAPIPVVRPEPKYDAADYARGVHGEIKISVTVDRQGLPTNIKIVKALDPVVDKKVLEAVEKWKFQPGMKDGKPVIVQANIDMEFDLTSKGGPKK
jgi:TonB family protein